MKGVSAGEKQAASPKGEVADPHPSTDEDYDKIPNPGGPRTPKKPGIGPNSYAHDGTPPPRPKNDEAKSE